MEPTKKEIDTKVSNNPKANFSINDCPLSVWRGISEPAKEYCNDQYWVRIKELLEKEQELLYLKLALENYAIIKDDTPKQEVAPQSEKAQPIPEVKKEKVYMGKAKRERENE